MFRALARTRGAATDFAPACTRLRGWTRSRCAGSRMGVGASRKSGNGKACEAEEASCEVAKSLEKCNRNNRIAASLRGSWTRWLRRVPVYPAQGQLLELARAGKILSYPIGEGRRRL